MHFIHTKIIFRTDGYRTW